MSSGAVFALLQHFREAREQVRGVQGARGGLGVVLDAEDLLGLVADAFDGVVVEVHVGQLHVVRQRVRVDGEGVVLAGDLDAAGEDVAHRVVRAVVAELHLLGLGAQGD